MFPDAGSCQFFDGRHCTIANLPDNMDLNANWGGDLSVRILGVVAEHRLQGVAVLQSLDVITLRSAADVHLGWLSVAEGLRAKRCIARAKVGPGLWALGQERNCRRWHPETSTKAYLPAGKNYELCRIPSATLAMLCKWPFGHTNSKAVKQVGTSER